MTAGADARGPVVLCVEQLRRRVPGGIGTYVLGLVEGLRRIGAAEAPEVVLYASRGWRGDDRVAGLCLPVWSSPLPSPLLVRAWSAGVAGPGSRATTRPPRRALPGLVHATSLALPPSGAAPLVVTVHDVAWREVPSAFPPRARAWHERALARAARQAARVVVPSERTRLRLAAAGMGLEGSRVVVIPEGCDHLAPPDLAAAERLRRRLGVGEDYLLSVGTIEPRKNLARLVAAYRRARPSLPGPWPLLVVGPSGWDGPRVGGSGRGGGGLATAGDPDGAGATVVLAGDGVVLAGEVDPGVKTALYAGARCLVYVPLAEGFGLPAIEAMASGAPVVASSEVPSAGDAALTVDPRDVDAIAAAMVSAASDPAARERLSQSGLRHARGFTWESAARRHVELWRGLVEQIPAG